uniref:Uncharacterized protein n=1 Tax=Arundo donax TaxID=35708 RepID=A0A0A8YWZ0_ARUDO
MTRKGPWLQSRWLQPPPAAHSTAPLLAHSYGSGNRGSLGSSS